MNLGRKIRRLARLKYLMGQLDRETYKKIRDASYNQEIVTKWQDALQTKIPNFPKFPELWEWLKENWLQVLGILVSLLAFLEPSPEKKNEN